MTALFGSGRLFEGLVVAYLLPSLFLVLAYVGSRSKSPLWPIAQFLSLAVLLAAFLSSVWLGWGTQIRWNIVVFENAGAVEKVIPTDASVFANAGPFIGIGLIAAVMTIMLFPKAGLANYYSYKHPLFVGGVIFMPLFVVIAALLKSPIDLVPKGSLLVLTFFGFWLSAAWLAAKATHGEYVRGLEAPVKPFFLLGEKAPFRPDLILPGGVNYVKGTILTGVGLMIAIHNHLSLPRWEWWGFIIAFWGIIILIPIRGMLKMFHGRGPRMLGHPDAFGVKAGLAREILLFAGLLVLLYGFVNAFKGFVPFTVIGVVPKYDALPAAHGWFGVLLIILAFLVLVPLRAWYKTRLLEGSETRTQMFLKQLSLYVGTFLLIVGYIHLFNLPFASATMGESNYIWFYPDRNPIGFAIGTALVIAGALLILVFRPKALTNELQATIRVMVGLIADLPLEKRRQIMQRRIGMLVRMPEEQRFVHTKAMLEGLNALTESKRVEMLSLNIEILTQRPPEQRSAFMTTMDKVMKAIG